MRARSERRTDPIRLRLTLSNQSLSSVFNSTLGAVRIRLSSTNFQTCHKYSRLFAAHYTSDEKPPKEGILQLPLSERKRRAEILGKIAAAQHEVDEQRQQLTEELNNADEEGRAEFRSQLDTLEKLQEKIRALRAKFDVMNASVSRQTPMPVPIPPRGAPVPDRSDTQKSPDHSERTRSWWRPFLTKLDNFWVWALLVLVPMVLGVCAQVVVHRTFTKYSRMSVSSNCEGAQAADAILRAEDVGDVKIVEIYGTLSDHYDPRLKRICLSRDVFRKSSVSAVCIAGHESSHALQHATAYTPLK